MRLILTEYLMPCECSTDDRPTSPVHAQTPKNAFKPSADAKTMPKRDTVERTQKTRRQPGESSNTTD
jgi:hypothetical protein